MNKRRFSPGSLRAPRLGLPAFAFCAVSFLLGVLLGVLLSGGVTEGDFASELFSGYGKSVLSGGGKPNFTSVFLSVAWYHLLAILLSFTMLGVALIPLVSAVRGFTLSFTLAALVRLYASQGVAAGMLLVGFTALLSVPIFFLVSVDAMCASGELVRVGLLRQPPAGPGAYTADLFIRFLLALFLLLLISAGESALLGAGIIPLPAVF